MPLESSFIIPYYNMSKETNQFWLSCSEARKSGRRKINEFKKSCGNENSNRMEWDRG